MTVTHGGVPGATAGGAYGEGRGDRGWASLGFEKSMQSKAFGRDGEEICGTRRPRVVESGAFAFTFVLLGLGTGGFAWKEGRGG